MTFATFILGVAAGFSATAGVMLGEDYTVLVVISFLPAVLAAGLQLEHERQNRGNS